MTTISIIGSGNMATAIGTRAAQHGHTIEVISRNTAKAQALADQIGNGATGATPLGDIVTVAIPYTDTVSAVANYGEALADKILVDISNPFNADASGLVTTPGNSAAQEIAAAAPEDTAVVKALNTIFGHVLAPRQTARRVPRRRQHRGEGTSRRVSAEHRLAAPRRGRTGP
jgi:predicted dinucleotide-binding enzyme